jgi:hypothetical protein
MIFPYLLTMYGDAKVSMGRLQAGATGVTFIQTPLIPLHW